MTVLVDGLDAVALAAHVGAPRMVVHHTVGSTMDEAHRLAQSGPESGTVVVAEHQFAGRGRFGRRWISDPGRGLWATSIHRGIDTNALDVLSIRIGLCLATALDRFAEGRVTLKWPNDLFSQGRKLGGVLVEARWREAKLEWVAVGVGINLVPPADQPRGIGLRAGVLRSELLRAVVGPVAEACASVGELTDEELRLYAVRDMLRDARLTEPAVGVARGITANGALVVETASGRELFRRGSIVLAPEGA
ncbi:MAG: biotin--[acetyl-CoA-carboxylase] ligase [Gemmatimonadetes bacterium]|nr:biotin--[acetyl-CoA-carboxylase] ligase [Gemmatimonadota bacterium]